MKKMLLFFITSLLVVFVVGSLGTSVEAEVAEVNVNNMTPTEAPNIFYDKEFGGYYDVNSGGYIEVFEVKGGEVIGTVDMDEYVKRQASEPNIAKDENSFLNSEIDSSSIEIASPSVWYRYTESSNRSAIQYGRRASIVQKNPGPGSDTLTIGYSYTEGHSFSVSLNATQKSAVISGVGYTWNSTANISSSHKMTIPAGYQGYWRFDPRVRISNGAVKQYTHGVVTGSKSVRTTYPVKLNKQLDGELVAVKTRL